MTQAHCLTIKADTKINVIFCQIGIRVPNTSHQTIINGIWDTGASSSVITSNIARSLGLGSTGMSRVSASGHTDDRSTYVIDMVLPNGVIIGGLTVTDTPQLTGGIDALIGMDVIGMGDFSITNKQGKTCMSFRIPSLHEINYVDKPQFVVDGKKQLIKPSLSGSNQNLYTQKKGKR